MSDVEPQLPRWLRAVLSLSPSQLKVLGFLFGMSGTAYEAIVVREVRIGLLSLYASAMGLILLWPTGKSPPPAGGT